MILEVTNMPGVHNETLPKPACMTAGAFWRTLDDVHRARGYNNLTGGEHSRVSAKLTILHYGAYATMRYLDKVRLAPANVGDGVGPADSPALLALYNDVLAHTTASLAAMHGSIFYPCQWMIRYCVTWTAEVRQWIQQCPQHSYACVGCGNPPCSNHEWVRNETRRRCSHGMDTYSWTSGLMEVYEVESGSEKEGDGKVRFRRNEHAGNTW